MTRVLQCAPVHFTEWFSESPRVHRVAFEKLKAYLTLTAGWALSPAFRALAHFFLPKKVKSMHAQLAKLLESRRGTHRENTPREIYWALVAGEDSRFFIHRGFDISAILRAVWQLIWFGRLQGGSTIEQQLVRTVTGNYRRTLSRKVTEIALAACVSEVLSKRETLDAYLGIAHFGWRMEGICGTCQVLGYNTCNIRPAEAASLIARLKYPEPRIRTSNWADLLARRTRNILRCICAGSHEPGWLNQYWKENETVLVQRGS